MKRKLIKWRCYGNTCTKNFVLLKLLFLLFMRVSWVSDLDLCITAWYAWIKKTTFVTRTHSNLFYKFSLVFQTLDDTTIPLSLREGVEWSPGPRAWYSEHKLSFSELKCAPEAPQILGAPLIWIPVAKLPPRYIHSGESRKLLWPFSLPVVLPGLLVPKIHSTDPIMCISRVSLTLEP